MHHAEVCKGAEKKRIYTLYTRCIEHYVYEAELGLSVA